MKHAISSVRFVLRTTLGCYPDRRPRLVRAVMTLNKDTDLGGNIISYKMIPKCRDRIDLYDFSASSLRSLALGCHGTVPS